VKKRILLIRLAGLLLVGLAGPAWGESVDSADSAGPAARPLTQAEEVELSNSVNQLVDRTRDARTKAEAADLLLTRSYPQAMEAVKGLLQDGGNAAAQVAIAEGIARHGGRAEYVEPLMTMLIDAEMAVRSAAGRALATYKDPAVMRQMIALARDGTRDKSVRLPAIIALKRVLDKDVVDALVKLLDDRDAAVRDATMESLEILTNIRNFNDAAQWKAWWEANKNRDRYEWLVDLAESSVRTKTTLEVDNQKLRDRLYQALMASYTAVAASAGARDAFMTDLLKDNLADVRVIGLKLVQRRLDASVEPLSAEIRSQVRLLLADGDASVRGLAAATVGGIGDAGGVQALMDRLRLEDDAAVQAALLLAMGQLRDAKALPDVLPRLNSRYDTVCAAAAKALGWIAARQPLAEEQRQEAVRALVGRYQQAAVAGSDAQAVREALLGAMGVLQDKRFLPVFEAACKDGSANIRLMAVTAVVGLKDPASAESLLPLLNDPDRGVRLVAVAGVASLGGEKYLENVLQRIEPAVEPEPSVREAAWSAASSIFAQSSDAQLVGVCDRLKDRDDADVQYAQVLAVLVGRLREARSAELATYQRELAGALMKSRRPAEAAAQLAEILKNSPPTGATALEIWHEYVDCLLAADDPAVCRVLAEQTDEASFSQAVDRLLMYLEQETTSDHYHVVMAMVAEARRALLARLPERRRQAMLDMDAVCAAQRARADRALVTQQVVAFASTDEAVRSAAMSRVTALGDRALAPLIAELRKELTAAKPNAAVEKAMLDCVKQIAPHLNGYTAAASPSDKIARLDEWTRQVTTQPAN